MMCLSNEDLVNINKEPRLTTHLIFILNVYKLFINRLIDNKVSVNHYQEKANRIDSVWIWYSRWPKSQTTSMQSALAATNRLNVCVIETYALKVGPYKTSLLTIKTTKYSQW